MINEEDDDKKFDDEELLLFLTPNTFISSLSSLLFSFDILNSF
jgi:hypothetical protein